MGTVTPQAVQHRLDPQDGDVGFTASFPAAPARSMNKTVDLTHGPLLQLDHLSAGSRPLFRLAPTSAPPPPLPGVWQSLARAEGMATFPHCRQPQPVTRHSSHPQRVPSLWNGCWQACQGSVRQYQCFLWISSGVSWGSDVGVLSSALRLDWGWIGKNGTESPGWVNGSIRTLGSLDRILCPSEKTTNLLVFLPLSGYLQVISKWLFRPFNAVLTSAPVAVLSLFCLCVSCLVSPASAVFFMGLVRLHNRFGRLNLMGSSWGGMSFVPPSGEVSCTAFAV